jgi:hypothetical protein
MYGYRVKQRPVKITRKTLKGALILILLAVGYYNLLFLGPVPVRPEEFDIVFTYGYGPGNTLDTRDNTYTSRLTDPRITIEMTLTEKELDNIWRSIHQNHFYELNQQNAAYADSVDPPKTYTLKVIAEGYPERTLSMTKPGTLTLYEIRFFKITDTITNIIENKPAYKTLPPPKGGYA